MGPRFVYDLPFDKNGEAKKKSRVFGFDYTVVKKKRAVFWATVALSASFTIGMFAGIVLARAVWPTQPERLEYKIIDNVTETMRSKGQKDA